MRLPSLSTKLETKISKQQKTIDCAVGFSNQRTDMLHIVSDSKYSLYVSQRAILFPFDSSRPGGVEQFWFVLRKRLELKNNEFLD